MGEEFSFPTQRIDQIATDIMAAVTELGKLRQEMMESLGKAAGNWEGADATEYLGKVRQALDEYGESPGLMCANIGNRLRASLGNYTAAESIADSAMKTVKSAFK